MTMHVTTASAPVTRESMLKRARLSSFIGTVIEWYDFFIYGTAAALVFGKLFFPQSNALVGTMAAFGAFAVGFVARPIGGMLFGHYGDRLGRRAVLVATLTIMGLSTFLIGLLPTFNQIGVWAPVFLVLLRIAQGIALGGEWGGAALMVVEHAPDNERGKHSAWPQLGVPVGLVLATEVYGPFHVADARRFRAMGVALSVPAKHPSGHRWNADQIGDRGNACVHGNGGAGGGQKVSWARDPQVR